MKKIILQTLKETGFEITRDRLNAPSAKEFKEVFLHLVNCIDDCSVSDGSKRFEEDFTIALQCFGYPFLHQIETKWLAMPASMACWYLLLGVLHWLAELVNVGISCNLSFENLFRARTRQRLLS